MDPEYGLLAAALISSTLGLMLRPKRRRTDADRLRDLDAAEQVAIARANNPHVIAAAAKREKRRQKLLRAA